MGSPALSQGPDQLPTPCPGNPGAESRSTWQGQAPGAHDARGPTVWVAWEEGELCANGQLVTKPTSFLKLGHRRETGTAELSPNRTVAHLVPGPSGTPGRWGWGEQEAAPGHGDEIWFGGQGPASLRPARAATHLAQGQSNQTRRATGLPKCPTPKPLITWILCLEHCSPSCQSGSCPSL